MIKLTDEQIRRASLDAGMQEHYMGFHSGFLKFARAIEAEVLRINGGGGDISGPPFGSKRKAAMAIYKPPFRFAHGYIHDSSGNMVADQDGFDGKVAESVAARVRGWGRIGYMPNPEELQDEVGQMMADALTAYYATPQPQQAAPGAVLEGPRLIADEDMARLRWAEYVFGSVQHAIHSTESVSYSRALNDLRRAISSIEESLSAAPKPQGE